MRKPYLQQVVFYLSGVFQPCIQGRSGQPFAGLQVFIAVQVGAGIVVQFLLQQVFGQACTVVP
jgi:hypothetical protein